MQDSQITSIGIDFGGTSVKLGVCRGADLLLVDEPIPTAAHPGPAALIGAMAERIAKLPSPPSALACPGWWTSIKASCMC